MAVQSKLIDVLPADYGYVIFTAVGSMCVNAWLAMNVMRARKAHNIKVLLNFELHHPANSLGQFC